MVATVLDTHAFIVAWHTYSTKHIHNAHLSSGMAEVEFPFMNQLVHFV